MIVTSAHHPDLFKLKMLEVPGFAHWMSEHLLHMAHSHVIVTNAPKELKEGVLGMSRELLPGDVAEVFRAKFNTMADKSRILIVEKGFDLTRHANAIDVVITPDESEKTVRDAMDAFGVGPERVCCWSDFRKKASCRGRGPVDESVSKVELRSMSAQSLKGMNRDILEHMHLRPLLVLAPSVHIIDKIIGEAFLAKDSIKREERLLWGSFECALHMIFRAWAECCQIADDERGGFVIVTRKPSNRGDSFKKNFENEIRSGFDGIDSETAKKFSVDWKSEKAEFGKYDAEHDRYLGTGRHWIMFSAGFDIFERPAQGCGFERARCKQGTVSFYKG
jgi:hypothetical protein